MRPEILDRINLFAGLTPEQRRVVADRLREERFPAETRIFSEGDAGDRLYVIESGTVRISREIRESSEEALAVMKPGQYFGEMSLIDDQPRCADAIADANTVLHSMGRADFHDLLQSDLDICNRLLVELVRTMAGRMRESNERVKSMYLMSMW